MSWVKGLFGSGEKSPLPDLSGLLVDMHSHLIPGIDDGVQSMEESLNMIRQLHSFGYKKLITTPHINVRFPNTPEIIKNGLTLVKEMVEKEKIPVSIEAAAEYYIEDGIEKIIGEGNLLTFGNKSILVELSYFIPYPAFSNVIYELQMASYDVILAHAERYTYWHNKFAEYENLKARDVKLQVNFSSLTGYYSIPVRNTARTLIDNGWIDYAGTDVHNQQYLKLLKQGLRDKYAEKLLASGTLKNKSLL
jgi:protein-tyrosine phosphatase